MVPDGAPALTAERRATAIIIKGRDTPMHVAVAIVSYRNAADVLTCLAALTDATHADFEVVICENGGADACAALVAQLPARLPGGQAVRAVPADNPGYAGGVNICMAEAPEADAWWVLNPDTAPEPGAMAALVARLSKGDCQMTGGVLLGGGGKVQAYGGLWRTWVGRSVSMGMFSAADAPVDQAAIERRQNYVVGASMMLNRRWLETIGPMREDYFLYCEEVEWCVRGLNAGLRLGFAPQAVVHHQQGTTTGAGGSHKTRSRLATYLSSRNMILMTRDLYPWKLPTATLGVLAGALFIYGRRGAWVQARYHAAGVFAGLGNERGVPGWMRTAA